MSKSVLIFSKRDDSNAKMAGKSFAEWLEKKNLHPLDVSGSEEKITESAVKNVSMGVVFGGDGSFLTLVRRLERKDLFPLMGVNLGSLGFITEIGKEELTQAMENFLAGKTSEELRPLVSVEMWRGNKCLESGLVFNDAVINKDVKTTMLGMDVRIDGDLLSRTRGDGYIISTPTGSTGYALSSGGALIHPQAKAMLLRPICAHALSVRSVVIPQKMLVEIELTQVDGLAYLVCDGQISLEVKSGDTIKVRVSETSLRMIRSPNQTWPDVLRAKLHMD